MASADMVTSSARNWSSLRKKSLSQRGGEGANSSAKLCSAAAAGDRSAAAW